jgi:osmotically-inducible protein OsmY
MMMKLLLLIMRKPNEHGINIGLRILALSLSIVLFFLVAYYFLSVNRVATLPEKFTRTAQQSGESERYKVDIALMGRIKAVLGQSKRLHGYSIGVECKDGAVNISGEVPTQIDKDLAEKLILQTQGVNTITNNLSILPAAARTNQETSPSTLPVKVEDFELEANLRERISSTPGLANAVMTIKVKSKIVTLNGTVANEQIRSQIEEIVRNFPQVSQVNNQIKIPSQ